MLPSTNGWNLVTHYQPTLAPIMIWTRIDILPCRVSEWRAYNRGATYVLYFEFPFPCPHPTETAFTSMPSSLVNELISLLSTVLETFPLSNFECPPSWKTGTFKISRHMSWSGSF